MGVAIRTLRWQQHRFHFGSSQNGLERRREFRVDRRCDQAPEQLARLGVALAIGPNFSHFLDVPRPDNLSSRKRQLICLDEMYRAGLSPVPHLSAAQKGDWRFWQDYLRDNATVRFVAVEFQTGNANWGQGRNVIDRVAEIRDDLGRRLHLLVIGGAQFVEYLAARLGDFSLIDSTPFMKAVKRQKFDPTKTKRPWKKVRTEKGQPLDDLTAHNLTHYSAWIERRSQERIVELLLAHTPSPQAVCHYGPADFETKTRSRHDVLGK